MLKPAVVHGVPEWVVVFCSLDFAYWRGATGQAHLVLKRQCLSVIVGFKFQFDGEQIAALPFYECQTI
tara:strand:- start:791 stop:994 length:204 start_codon:yes stop_codon:yes gene_type:complete